MVIPFIVDWHQDISSTILYYKKDFGKRNIPSGLLKKQDSTIEYMNQSDIPRLQESMFKIIIGNSFPVVLERSEYKSPENFWNEYEKHAKIYDDILQNHQDVLQKITNQKELDDCLDSNKLGVLLSVEGLYGWQDGDFATIDQLIARGVRSIGIMWNMPSNVGIGTSKEYDQNRKDTGLTHVGKTLVRYLAKKGIIVDISHASRQTSLDILSLMDELGEENIVHPPAIASHSASRAVTNHVRNLTDDVALSVAKQGGIIGIPFLSAFVGGNTIKHVIAHVNHFKNLGILDHIGIGTDFDGMLSEHVIEGLEDVAVTGKSLAYAMDQTGYTQKEITDIFGGNSIRFLQKYLPTS